MNLVVNNTKKNQNFTMFSILKQYSVFTQKHSYHMFSFIKPFPNSKTSLSQNTTNSAFKRKNHNKTSNNKQLVLSIEGNIGSGKSTLINILKTRIGSDIEVMTEPVTKWTNCRGENMLGAFYSDPKRYAYTFQSFAFVTRMMAQQLAQEKKIRILERSSLSDHCFAKNCYDNGLMNDVEWAAYEEWWSFFANSLKGSPQGIIYLRTSPSTCYSRVQKRNRSEETTVSREYLDQLHIHHENWLPHGNNNKNNININDNDNNNELKIFHDTMHSLPYVILDEGENEFDQCEQSQIKMVDKVNSLIDYIERN